MNFDEQLRQKAQRESTPIPEEFSARVRETLDSLSAPKRKKSVRRWSRTCGTLIAASLALVFILPNSSAAMADTMAGLPVIGPLFQVITIRTYEDNSGNNHVSISNPQIQGQENSTGAQEINAQVEQYINSLIDEYEQTAKEDGYFNLDVTWEVVTNTDRWFTLRINSDLIMASGNHQEQYFHIDVSSGEQKRLSDLFPEDFDYIRVISDELKSQMKARMEADSREIYWLKGVSELGTYYFDTIAPDQDFYFNSEGQLVIPFDKYEVGPGTTGSPHFTLTSPELYQHLLIQP